ncbi:Spy/CpxP family protein refolding chaperone [Rhodopseudomonas sp. P2A-2r]|uniref:Spy/CpxP family protein refolding chaperone n=1 Tax=Rhodopseudomonas sp. P2A-2r TaxID=2991972 RepID=UPI0022345E8A|nr:Spy/CpxP family protein refolding chaperone [Rhodopseudomonas sp. P2A-2r]UZE46948.1 Spy/CpxP family protein refolding chaperone [Rhodopseudomonas sp. P2A-2r]
MKHLTMVVALAAAALSTPAWSQSPADHNAHHPSDTKSEAVPANPAPPASQPDMKPPQGGMGNMPMMGMMTDMKNMMSSMSRMKSAGQSMEMMGRGMVAIDHVEGRIAFLRTEINITDAQAGAWNGFADALRVNANKLAEVRASMMSGMDGAQAPVATLADRLDLQEKWLLARLDGTRTMKSAFAKLNEILSDDQKKAADDLLAPHMGMGAMAVTASPMSRDQMQSGQMGPGQMQRGHTSGMKNK